MPGKVATTTISTAKYRLYWRNAEECLGSMRDAFQAQRWHVVALTGVHCVIAAADALLIRKAGLRCKGESHLDVFGVLAQYMGEPESDKMLRQGIEIVRRKTDIEYRAQPISESDAAQLMRQVERFYEWARKKLDQ